MRISIIVLFIALLLAAVSPGCSLLKPGESESKYKDDKSAAQAGKDDARAEEDREAKRKSLERKLEIAQARMKHAAMELQAHEKAAAESIAYAEQELAMAEGKMVQFTKFDRPNRIDREELNLQRARDYAVEAAEELQQIMIMYDEADLEDMTAEFVINRGKRNAERQEQALAIQEKTFQALVEHEIPRESAALELEVQKKRDALEKARFSAESGILQKKIAVMNVELEIADLKDQLAALDRKADSK